MCHLNYREEEAKQRLCWHLLVSVDLCLPPCHSQNDRIYATGIKASPLLPLVAPWFSEIVMKNRHSPPKYYQYYQYC